MGRKAGVSAAETRAALLDAAARVFAAKGYDGASISDITSEAGLSSGAIYSNYGGKAELFAATVREHARRDFAGLVGLDDIAQVDGLAERGGDVTEVLSVIGRSYANSRSSASPLLVEAIVAAKRHPDVGVLINSWVLEGETAMGAAITQAQESGLMASGVTPEVISRFLTIIGLGARLAGSMGLPGVDNAEWERLIAWLVDNARREPPAVSS